MDGQLVITIPHSEQEMSILCSGELKLNADQTLKSDLGRVKKHGDRNK